MNRATSLFFPRMIQWFEVIDIQRLKKMVEHTYRLTTVPKAMTWSIILEQSHREWYDCIIQFQCIVPLCKASR